ncbi:MAG: tetratricopeptide repeat protein, partial [Candidatus Solibacter sp.]|nr:tetratricopeptide repeat protein [Candidatus Solibacter sp.]
MRSIRLVAVVLAVLVALASCSRDPNVVKRRYLESGNKYFEKERYKEASIQYRNALKRDPKYGAAYYKLALVSLRMNEMSTAVPALRRAVELVPPDQPDHWDAVVRLSEIYLAAARTDKQFLGEAEKLIKDLLKHEPNSFDAHRLTGDLNYSKAMEAYKDKRLEEWQVLLTVATGEYHK